LNGGTADLADPVDPVTTEPTCKPAVGFLLWFNNFALRHFPKWITDAATAVHWYEALLASFSILLWHYYMVIFDPLVYPMDTAWLDGKVRADHYRHSRPAYLHALKRVGLLVSAEQETPGETKADFSAKPAQKNRATRRALMKFALGLANFPLSAVKCA
jgi:hypothetical protein